jgi:hypothetical protein
MSYKNHTIFGPKDEKNELEKLFIFINAQGNWCFEKDKKHYNLSPPEITRISLPPIASGADLLIKNACLLKNIDYRNGIYILFNENEFINYDFKLEYCDKLLDGWLYNVYSDKFKINNGQKIWACSYLDLYYKNPPKTFYIELQSTYS